MALTFVPMIIAVLIGILMNNACLGDVRDLLRAEIKGTRDMMDAKFDAVEAKMERNHSEMSRRFAELDTRIGRIESSLGMQR
jgi:hypothetical protein